MSISDRYSTLFLFGTWQLIDHQTGTRRAIDFPVEPGNRRFLLDGRIMALDVKRNAFFELDTATAQLLPCTMLNEKGEPCHFSNNQLKIFTNYGQEPLLLQDNRQLFVFERLSGACTYRLRSLPIEISENCEVYSIAYRPEAGLVAVGTTTSGLLIYRLQRFKSLQIDRVKKGLGNAHYAQALLDSNTLLTTFGDLIDLSSDQVKGRFPYRFNKLYLHSYSYKKLFFNNPPYGAYVLSLDEQAKPRRLRKDYMEFRSFVRINDTLWTGTNRGIAFVQGDSLVSNFPWDFCYEKSIRNLCFDNQNNLWFANLEQLYRHPWGTQQLDSFPELSGSEFRSISAINGHIFVSTYGRGYYVFNEKQGIFKQMPIGNNNQLLHTHALIVDKKGYLWLTSNRGLYRTHIDAVERYLQDSTQQIIYNVYLEEDGISSSEFNGGCSPSFLWLPDGRLSLPTMDGLVLFDPLAIPERFSRDSIFVESFQNGDSIYSLNAPIRVPANHRSITIRFATPWWEQPFNLKIWYKLEGLHENFHLLPSEQRRLTFEQLRPGNYRLILQKQIGHFPEDVIETSLRFTVNTPWYLTPLASLFYFLSILLIIWLSSYLYAYSIRQNNIALQKKVDAQTGALQESNLHLAQNIHKLEQSENKLRNSISVRDRLISVLSHDILTPLRYINLIARLSSQDDPKDDHPAQKALLDVRNASEKLFHSTQNVLNWVKYQQQDFKVNATNCSPYALVEELVEAFQEMARYQGNELINEVPEDDVIRTDAQILTIVLHNLLSNAIKYTKNGQISVHSAVEHHWYVLEVRDTGRGMSAAQLESVRAGMTAQRSLQADDAAGNGIGLYLVAELLHTLGGRWELVSSGGKGVCARVFLRMDVVS